MEYYVISSYSQFGRLELIVLNKSIAPLIIIIIIANTYKAPLTKKKGSLDAVLKIYYLD